MEKADEENGFSEEAEEGKPPPKPLGSPPRPEPKPLRLSIARGTGGVGA